MSVPHFGPLGGDTPPLAALAQLGIPGRFHTMLSEYDIPANARAWHVQIGPVNIAAGQAPVQFLWPLDWADAQNAELDLVRAWDGYTLELIGRLAAPDSIWPGPTFDYADPTATPPECHLEVWLERLTPNGSQTYVDVLTLPGDWQRGLDGQTRIREHVSFRWHSVAALVSESADAAYDHPDLAPAEIAALQEGLRRLRGAARHHHTRGRKPLRERPGPERLEIVAKVRELKRQHRKITWSQLQAHTGVAERTLRRWWGELNDAK